MAALETIDGRYPVVTEVQHSQLFEVAKVADLPQPVPAQNELLQLGQQLQALDLPQPVTVYMASILQRLR